MTRWSFLRRLSLRAVALLFTGVLCSGSARANASCNTLIANTYKTLQSQSAFYWFDMTIHRFNVNWVSYSTGTLHPDSGNAAWPLRGSSNQLFSDRYYGTQPFNIGAPDQLSVRVSSSGRLYIYYSPWAYTTDWDMSCTGRSMTKVVPGFGSITLTLRTLERRVR
jgi:hypothetical protein